jgi:predicted RNase H-like HicB family nuclease
MEYLAVVHKDLDGGYFANILEINGCFTQADSLDDLKINIQDAILVSLDITTDEVNYRIVYAK